MRRGSVDHRAAWLAGLGAAVALSAACGNDGGDGQTCESLGVPAIGTCFDDQLIQCTQSGIAKATNCPEACTIAEDGTPACLELPDGSSLVTGAVYYEDRPLLVSGSYGTMQTLPVRGAAVSVVSETSGVLATGSTSEQGTFAISYVAGASDTSVYVLVATASNAAWRPGKVKNNASQVYGLESESFAPSRDTELSLVAGQSGLGRAFNLFDQTVRAADYIHGTMGEETIKPFGIIWYTGSQDGSYYDGSNIHLVGNSGDDDGYDDPVVMHEIGHYMADNYAVDDSPGGAHDGTPTSPRLAWSEGFATYFSMAVRDEPFYADWVAGGGFGDNLDTSVTKVAQGSANTVNVSENMVAEILWDAGDGDRAGQSDDDAVRTMGHQAVLAIAQGFRASDPGAGQSGIDLADWIASVFSGGANQAHCGGLLDIILTNRRFPFPYSC